MHATCRAYLILIDVIILIIFGEACDVWSSPLQFTPTFHHFIYSRSIYFRMHTVLGHPQLVKMTILWGVALCSLLEVEWLLRALYGLHHHHPNDGGSKLIWNFGQLLPDFTAQHPRRQLSLYSLPGELEISLSVSVDENLYLRIFMKIIELFQFSFRVDSFNEHFT
jgi:hypothetical protein